MAVPEDLRSRWTYVRGTSRRRLPGLVRKLQRVDLFIHDSLHTARNTCFELGTVWPALPPGGVAVVDDIDRNLGFSRFTERRDPRCMVRDQARYRKWSVGDCDQGPAAALIGQG